MRISKLSFAVILFCFNAAYGADTKITSGNWTLSFDNGINITYNGSPVVTGVSSAYLYNGRKISSDEYDKKVFKTTSVNSKFGKGVKWDVVYSNESLPTLTQSFYLYKGKKYIMTDITISSDKIMSTNYLAPVIGKIDKTLYSGSSKHTLFIPYDNDSWIRFKSPKDAGDSLRSYEVTSIYDSYTRNGIIIGAIEHDTWKNAIDLFKHSSEITAFSGVADKLTRDNKEHGAVSDKKIKSAMIVIGCFEDWRKGMDCYASLNTTLTPQRKWDKAVPFGWNSWGTLQFKVNHKNTSEVIDFIADSLQCKSFANSDGLVYTGIDSGWSNFTEAELKDYASHCRQKNQVPCIYWTPFTYWGQNAEKTIDAAPEYKYKDVYLYAKGKTQELDGGLAIDPTHPAVEKMIKETADMFRRCGFKYVKMDFMTHGRLEADSWYRKDITTGTEAYNYGMQLIDRYFSNMYINLSISPIFPAQYAQSRRIACDSWNVIEHSEYTMNALSYGWWVGSVYDYNDADHVVLRDATEGENRARVTSSVITGIFINGDDLSNSDDKGARTRAMKYLTNPDINHIANGIAFRPLNGDNENSDNCFIRHEKNGDVYLIVFNYTDKETHFKLPADRMGLNKRSDYKISELWSHTDVIAKDDITIPSKDVKVFLFKKI